MKTSNILKIEEIEPQELIDIEVEDTHMFFANGIYTHNSGSSGSDPSKEDTADSYGIVMTMDVQIAIIETPEMKAKGLQMFKQLRNRMRAIKPENEKWMVEVNKDKQQIIREVENADIIQVDYNDNKIPDPVIKHKTREKAPKINKPQEYKW
jgi:intein/homing endonuclease